ncbi:MAG: (E)-4-hydroxy-3-methylbut-2-enyl-diphosphate synthase [Bacteroidota bacterium]
MHSVFTTFALNMEDNQFKYCNSLTHYSRFKTREVKIGDIALGANNPIRIQSMTTTDTMNTIATVEQSIRIIDAGGEYVRITAPSINEAQNLKNIKDELRKRGYTTPLIADIHFTPNAAEIAARIVEKVRINPGNYADKKKFENIEYTDAAYQEELDRIRERFIPLVKICKEYGTAMRIGTNHGSLSDRIMSRYGDTPLGMVESAFEFLRICEDLNYYDIVLSMKASNPQVMVQAYRLLVHKMMETGRDYPLHLGVTEAGDGEDGRIKSAIGIGTLLEDGLGDTIRVSLTEDPEFEIPVAKDLADRYNKNIEGKLVFRPTITKNPINPFVYNRRVTHPVLNIGGHQVPVVIAELACTQDELKPVDLVALGYQYDAVSDKWNIGDMACDYLIHNEIYNEDMRAIDFEIPGTLGIIYPFKLWQKHQSRDRFYPYYNLENYQEATTRSKVMNFIKIGSTEVTDEVIMNLKKDPTAVLLLYATHCTFGMADMRRVLFDMIRLDAKTPVVLLAGEWDGRIEQDQLTISTELGGLLLDGMGDGISINEKYNGHIEALTNRTAFGILQATRTRISKTEYISCPSCGRTLFDLQETTAKIRQRTDHLKGVKIAIMGCIVNGPGEMADADYGYVGVGIGKITLYRGKNIVKRGIDSSLAVDALIDLIKEDGIWIDKK